MGAGGGRGQRRGIKKNPRDEAEAEPRGFGEGACLQPRGWQRCCSAAASSRGFPARLSTGGAMSLQIRSLHGPAHPGMMLNSSPSPSSSTPGCCGLCSAPSQAMQKCLLGVGVHFPVLCTITPRAALGHPHQNQTGLSQFLAVFNSRKKGKKKKKPSKSSQKRQLGAEERAPMPPAEGWSTTSY